MCATAVVPNGIAGSILTGILLAAATVAQAAPQSDDKPPVLHRADSNSGSNSSGRKSAAISAEGIVREIDGKTIAVEALDSRIINCKLTSGTAYAGPDGKLTADDIIPGMRVKITAKLVSADDLAATLILVESTPEKVSPTGEDPAVFSKPPDNDPQRPILRSGIPSKRKATSDDEDADSTPAHSRASLGSNDDQEVTKKLPNLIEKARNAEMEFNDKLPNFVCQQFTTRYQRESKASGWHAQDVVTATVVYVDGKENYEDIKVGNRAVQKGMMDIEGQRSVGEFGSVVHSLLQRAGNDDFRFVRDADVKRLHAKVYDFTVKRQDSDWRILVGGQTIIPGYSGTVWIDRDSARVLRLFRQADNVPEAFPMDTIEQTVDYDFILIGGEKILLPSESENLSCQRGTPYCGKNVLEFRNYKQFKGEAKIDFDK